MSEEVKLILATVDDAELIHQMQYESFLPLYEKYHDDETSPVKEKIDKVTSKITNPNSQYYLIQLKGENVGAIRIVCKLKKNTDVLFISPLFILPEYQNRGIGQTVVRKVFDIYPDDVTWRLDTIKQEKGNCHLYEKCGFVRVGDEHIVNENMTLVNYEKPR